MEDIKQNILETSLELFKQYGIRSVSIDDICRRLGMSKKTFYQYFPGKTELVEEVLLFLQQRSLECAHKYTEGKSALECVRLLQKVHSNIEDVHDKPTFHYDLQKYYPKQYKQHLHNIHNNIRHILEQHLRQGIKEGLYRKSLDVEMCATMYSLIQYMFVQNENELKSVDVKRLMSFAISSFFRSIVSTEGAELLKNEFPEKN
ncbi:MAG: TetR/AcrR family transcriptional regulator [Paludibacteraceae bacterium]|nr:TetR/AcrR family transcriptional regulator [Paludibacteraceae bacterium]